MKRNLFKDHIQAIRPYEPGKPIKEVERELGLRRVIKLASNENPLGPSRKAMRAMRRAVGEMHLYPEGTCYYLIKQLARELGTGEDELVVGNGSNEIIELLARGFLETGDEVLSSEGTFLVYPILAQTCGANFVGVPMKDYRYDLEGILAAVTPKTKIIFIANPNNPTGTYVTETEVRNFLARVPENMIVCFDEAYVDFVEAPDFPRMLELFRTKPNVILLRTFSKSYGLAGLRIGYGIANPRMIAYLHKIRQPFNVNAMAQAAALAALEDRFFLWRTKRLVTSGRRYLYKHFKRLGLRYLPSEANFILVDTGCDGQEVFEGLLSSGMIVRSMTSYGFTNWIRVSIGRRSQNSQLVRLLRAYLRKKGNLKQG